MDPGKEPGIAWPTTPLQGCPLLTQAQVEALARFGIDQIGTVVSLAQVPGARPWLASILAGDDPENLAGIIARLAEACGLDPGACAPQPRPMGLIQEAGHGD